jgi:aminoacyl tRNA synthase complex-interacting multifunctional protein 1
VREIASGLQKFVNHQDMKGKVLVMTNLKPRPLAGFNSNGMVVCASTPDHKQV